MNHRDLPSVLSFFSDPVPTALFRQNSVVFVPYCMPHSVRMLQEQLLNQIAESLEELSGQANCLRAGQELVLLRISRLERKMASVLTKADFDKVIAEIDADTTAVGDRIDKQVKDLADALAKGGGSINPNDANAIMDALTNEASRLRSLAADPANAVPPLPGPGPSPLPGGAPMPTPENTVGTTAPAPAAD